MTFGKVAVYYFDGNEPKVKIKGKDAIVIKGMPKDSLIFVNNEDGFVVGWSQQGTEVVDDKKYLYYKATPSNNPICKSNPKCKGYLAMEA